MDNEDLQQIARIMPDHLRLAHDHLRAYLAADCIDPDEPGSVAALDYKTELLDITERLEDLIALKPEK